MLTLAFDTSSKTASVAILRDETAIYDIVLDTGKNHSEVLLSGIEEALARAGVKISDMDLLACTLGPGSFTGLRIGVSTLKGLMLATGKPAVGVSSLAALALNAGRTAKTIGSVMDAGRGQVYLAYYRFDQEWSLIQLAAEIAGEPESIGLATCEGIVYVGDGAAKYADVICRKSAGEIELGGADQQYIHASSVGRLALEKFKKGQVLDLHAFTPVYLRSADALPKKQMLT